MADNSLSVGKSDRTPYKHGFLDKYLGIQSGVISRQEWLREHGVTLLDLTAGDGFSTIQSGTSSPSIICKHANYLVSKGVDTRVVLVERDRSTFEQLRHHSYVNNQHIHLINGDARQQETVDQISLLVGNSTCFVSNDPNKVKDFALTSEMLTVCGERVTTFSTLGCNVGGIKREPRNRRDWDKLIAPVIDNTLSCLRFDACLIRLIDDKAQWAYLITTPLKWRDRLESVAHKTLGKYHKGIELRWLKEDSGGFNLLTKELFLTKEEFEQEVG